MESLGYSQEQSSALFLLGAVGIGAGALLAGYLSGRHIEFGIVPWGAFFISIACFWLGLDSGNIAQVCIAVSLFGVGAGLFVIPLSSFLQWRAGDNERGEILAASAFFSWCSVLLAALLLQASASAGLSAAGSFHFFGFITLVMTLLSFVVLPDFFVKFILMLLTKSFYRLKVINGKHVPTEGGALLVSNHVAYTDALVVGASVPRRVRFIMWDKVYEANPLLRKFYDILGVIPISPGAGQEKTEKTIEAVRKAIQDGFLVCIFAEGQLTRSGQLAPFKRGLERIMEGLDEPILPVHLGGVWGSVFSFSGQGPTLERPKHFPYPIEVSFGECMPSDSLAQEVREQVAVLEMRYFERELAQSVLKEGKSKNVCELPDHLASLQVSVFQDLVELRKDERFVSFLPESHPLWKLIVAEFPRRSGKQVTALSLDSAGDPPEGKPIAFCGVEEARRLCELNEYKGSFKALVLLELAENVSVSDKELAEALDCPVYRMFCSAEQGGVLLANLPNKQFGKKEVLCMKAGSLGRALPGIATRVRSSGKTLGIDQIGELEVALPQYPAGEDVQWKSTGVQVRFDKEGFFFRA